MSNLKFIFSSISSENRGFKMLSKLGWSEGQSLGKNDSGLLEPVIIMKRFFSFNIYYKIHIIFLTDPTVQQ